MRDDDVAGPRGMFEYVVRAANSIKRPTLRPQFPDQVGALHGTRYTRQRVEVKPGRDGDGTGGPRDHRRDVARRLNGEESDL